jgi:hypothetical protein
MVQIIESCSQGYPAVIISPVHPQGAGSSMLPVQEPQAVGRVEGGGAAAPAKDRTSQLLALR